MPAKTSRKPLRIGLAGCGIGRIHLEAFFKLPDLYEVAAICDVDLARATSLANRWGITCVTENYSDLCANTQLDLIDICTPPAFHYTQICEALQNGKHVICEKPLVGSLREVDTLIEKAASGNHVLMPILNYRFGHGIQKLRHLVDLGLAGKHYLATVETAWLREAWYYNSSWRGRRETEFGGILLQHAIHAQDMLTFVCGPVRNVFARTATRVNSVETEDCAAISFEFCDGSLGTLAATLGSCEQISRHRFCFSGLVAESILDPHRNSSDPWRFTARDADKQSDIETALQDFDLGLEGFEAQFAALYYHLMSGESLPVTLHDARAALELISAMYYSAESQSAVELPLSNTHPFYGGWNAPTCSLAPGWLEFGAEYLAKQSKLGSATAVQD